MFGGSKVVPFASLKVYAHSCIIVFLSISQELGARQAVPAGLFL
jgi:hypothetical protein